MLSIWSDSVSLPHFEKLQGNIKTDVLIIGGGMAGILCAHKLKQSGVDYVLVEASTICSGVTKNTTAKITVQHGLIYDKLIKSFGAQKAAMYLKANQDALKEYKKLCEAIDCGYEEKDSFVYSLNDRAAVEKEIDALGRLHVNAEFVEELPLPFSVAGAVKLEHQAQFNPLKFVSAVADGLRIYENTMVKELIGCKAVTDGGTVTANKIIVTTHFPFLNKHGSYFLKMYQHRSYAIALKNAPNVEGMYVDAAQKGLSFRNAQGYLLIGGGDHRTGKAGGNWQELREFAKRYYPSAEERYHWATQDCMTLDGVPYIGQYSKRTPGLYVATGFNKWGMTASMVSATILTDEIMGKQNPCAAVFSPSRSILKPQLAVNAWEAITSLLTISRPRCPHLGCALKWNPAEHSWDCPCHGSRFNKQGILIDNPAMGNLKE